MVALMPQNRAIHPPVLDKLADDVGRANREIEPKLDPRGRSDGSSCCVCTILPQLRPQRDL